jgi:hypothetical protein
MHARIAKTATPATIPTIRPVPTPLFFGVLVELGAEEDDEEEVPDDAVAEAVEDPEEAVKSLFMPIMTEDGEVPK